MEQGFSIKPKEMELEKADKYIGSDFTRAKNTAEMLEKKYPGWLWAVHTMDGVVVVKSMRLSGSIICYVIKYFCDRWAVYFQHDT